MYNVCIHTYIHTMGILKQNDDPKFDFFLIQCGVINGSIYTITGVCMLTCSTHRHTYNKDTSNILICSIYIYIHIYIYVCI